MDAQTVDQAALAAFQNPIPVKIASVDAQHEQARFVNFTSGPTENQAKITAAQSRSMSNAPNAPNALSSGVILPAHLPAACVRMSAVTYGVPEMVLVAMIKQESGGHLGAVGYNKNGTQDLGIAQFNTSSWARELMQRYGIPKDRLMYDACQSIHAQAFVLKTEMNSAPCMSKSSWADVMWCGVGRYHSPTEPLARDYVQQVYSKYRTMMARGSF